MSKHYKSTNKWSVGFRSPGHHLWSRSAPVESGEGCALAWDHTAKDQEQVLKFLPSHPISLSCRKCPHQECYPQLSGWFLAPSFGSHDSAWPRNNHVFLQYRGLCQMPWALCQQACIWVPVLPLMSCLTLDTSLECLRALISFWIQWK